NGSLRIAPHLEVATMLIAQWDETVATEATWLSWTFEGIEHTSPQVAREPGSYSEALLGLPADVSTDVVLHHLVAGVERTSDPLTATTGSLPPGLPAPVLVASDPARMRTEPYVLTSVNAGDNNFFGPCYTVVLDAQGRIVWYRPTSGSRLTVGPRIARSGGYLLIDESVTYVGGDATVTRTTLDLLQQETIPVPGMFLVFDELDDGSLLLDGRVSDFEFHLTRQYPDGTQERIWSCNPWMAPFSSGYWACAPNTLEWSPERGTVLWSMFQTSTVAEVDLATGEVVAEFGQFPGGATFAPRSANLELQHNPNWTSDGTFLVSTHVPGDDGVQMAREFAWDESAGTLTEIWSAEAPAYAEYEGGIWKLGNGNYLWELGTAGILVELTPEGDEVWKIDWDRHMTGTVTVLTDLYALDAGF
ncbi:MAG: hypothetical protein H0V89_14095, partial [Deltaproteobacteria bacterium]|nr:hypothetical protein [Deltaproteobacteria bacterium]